MLQLLQQRTKLSSQIGRMKRRHGAVIYVPDRERELLVRLTQLSKGQPPARAVVALYREILSSSRAAQGQEPIGLLAASAKHILPASRAAFGACDQFAPKKSWRELTGGVAAGKLSLALLTGEDLLQALLKHEQRIDCFRHLTVSGDFAPPYDNNTSLGQRIFIITPRANGAALEANRILILIECKSTQNAIKSLLQSMPELSIQTEHLPHRASSGRGARSVALVRLSPAQTVDGIRATSHLLSAAKTIGLPVSILGVYPGTEDYGG